MSWLLFGAVIGLIVLLGHIWRKWVAPWQRIEEMVGRIARGEKPPTFLLDGAAGPRQVGLDLEQLFDRQARLDQQIAERVSGANTVFAALQDGLLLVDRQRRITFVNRTFQELFGARGDDLGRPVLEVIRDPSLVRKTFHSPWPSFRGTKSSMR